MEVSLCSGKGCCPTVKVTENGASIGEGNEKVELSKDHWNVLVEKIQSGELSAI